MTGRREFSKVTRRSARARSGGLCEAAGELYGLMPGQRCNAPLKFGVEYDHVDPDRNSRDNSLENCCAACPRCHAFKTNNHDKPMLAKTQRQEDKNAGIRRAPSRISTKRWKRKLPTKANPFGSTVLRNG
jgi:hypothetical protein